MSRWPRTIWQVGALAAIPLNLSLATSAISPLLPTIRRETGISAAVGGLLTTIPLLCMGVLAPLAPRLARRFGVEHVIAAGLVVLMTSMLVRSVPGIAALFGGTLLLGASASGYVLVPGVIKRRFGPRHGPVIGLFSTGGLVGSVLGAGATVPLMHATGLSWRATLAVWAVVAMVTLFIWLPQMGSTVASDAQLQVPAYPALRHLYRDHLAWQVALYYGMQNLIYNGAAAWLPSLFVAHGVSQSTAGLLLATVSLTGMATTFSVPVLATRRPTQGPLVVATVALIATGLIGMLVAPVTGAIAWMIMFGLGQGAAFSLGLSLILLRSSDEQHAIELSGMTQTFGYLFSALGPVGLGVVHDVTGGWDWPLAVLLLLLLPLLVLGLGASRNGHVLAPPTSSG